MSAPAEQDLVVDKPACDYDHANAKVEHLVDTCKSPDAVAHFYDKWAVAYDKDLSVIEYGGPRYCAQLVSQYIPDTQARILDVAAGTGLIVDELVKLGHTYTNIDALDGSSQMLELAKKKSLYRNYICAFMYNRPTCDLEKDSYNGIVTCGSFTKGHLQSNVIEEFVRLTKPGGLIILILREENMRQESHQDLEPLMNELVSRGSWKLVERRVVKGYYGPYNGVGFVHQVL